MASRWIYRGVLAAGLAVTATQVTGQSTSAPIRNGELGFVIVSMMPALSAEDVPTEEACPGGLSLPPKEVQARLQTREGRAAAAALAKTYRAASIPPMVVSAPGREGQGAVRPSAGLNRPGWTNPDGSSICLNPTVAGPDPFFKTLDRTVRSEGMDLDGQASRVNGRAAPDTCAHDDFIGANGARNVDNQYLRVVGCSKGFQVGGLGRIDYHSTMIEGYWTIVMKLSNVDDLRNDPDVDVLISQSSDPIEFGADGKAVRHRTYALHANTTWRATAKGKIADGVLTTTPVDLRYHINLGTVGGPRPPQEAFLRRARLKLDIAPDGMATGLLAGYEDVDTLYRTTYGQSGSAFISASSADALNYTCPGIYYNMRRLADGVRDPATGKCTAISSQLKIAATPAFIVPTAPAAATPPK